MDDSPDGMRATEELGAGWTTNSWVRRQRRAHQSTRDDPTFLPEWVTTGTLFDSYIQIYGMVKTIRVSEEYHAWLAAHKRDDETMEETLRRMTRGPHPDGVAGLLSREEAAEAKEAVSELRARDQGRLDVARESFDRSEE